MQNEGKWGVGLEGKSGEYWKARNPAEEQSYWLVGNPDHSLCLQTWTFGMAELLKQNFKGKSVQYCQFDMHMISFLITSPLFVSVSLNVFFSF